MKKYNFKSQLIRMVLAKTLNKISPPPPSLPPLPPNKTKKT